MAIPAIPTIAAAAQSARSSSNDIQLDCSRGQATPRELDRSSSSSSSRLLLSSLLQELEKCDGRFYKQFTFTQFAV